MTLRAVMVRRSARDRLQALMQSPAHQAPAARLSGVTIAAFLIAAAQAPLGSTLIAVALPPLAQSLEINLALATGLLVTSYLITSIAAQSPGGRLGDVLGYARAVNMGMLLSACGAVLGLAEHGLVALTVARCLVALGGALAVPSTLALFRVYIPAERQGRVFGLFGAVMSLAAAIGPPLGGEIVARFGWRGIFMAHLPWLAVAALLAWWRPPPAVRAVRRVSEFITEFDWIGTLLLCAALSLLVAASKLSGLSQGMTLAGALLGTAAFTAWELRTKSPVFDPRLFTYRGFLVGGGIIALQNFAMYGLLFQLPQYFTTVRGFPPDAIGRYLFFLMGAMFIASPVGGRLTDRIGFRLTALTGCAPLLGGMAWMTRIGHFDAPSQAALPLFLAGMGIGLLNAPSQAAAMAAVPSSKAGMAAGGSSTLRYLGGTLTILMLSALLGGPAGQSPSGHEAATTAFAIAALLAALATLALPGPPRVRVERQ